jgi:hypothetical protein
MVILISLSKTDHDLIYHTISMDTTEHSFVSGFFAQIKSLSAMGQSIEIRPCIS